MADNDIGLYTNYLTVEIAITAPTLEPGATPFDLPEQGEIYHLELRVQDGPQLSGRVLRLDRAGLRAADADPLRQGCMLGQALFADTALGTAFRQALSVCQASDKGLRVRLRLEASGLHEIPWERLYYPLAEGWQPLGIAAATPFSRYVPVLTWERPQPVTADPLRILAIVASPQGLDERGLAPISENERQALHSTLDSLPNAQVTYLESGTERRPNLDEIRRALAEGYHLVHILSHGARTPRGTTLYLEDDQEMVTPVPAGKLVDVFSQSSSRPALCFLAACESATREQHDEFVPLAPALVTSGVPAVVAMTRKVGLQTAQAFARQFYVRLLAHGMVDLAVNEARTLVQERWDWSVPVLFSRLPDNKLLAADPRRVALETIRRWEQERYLPMPVEVVHLVGQPDPGTLERLGRLPSPALSLDDVLPRVFAQRQPAAKPGDDPPPKMVLLVGSHGTARSTQMRNIARTTARQSLAAEPDQWVIPIYVNLKDYSTVRSGPLNPIEVLAFEGLQQFWPELTSKDLARLIRRKDGNLLRVLIDGSDDLPERPRREAWRDFQAFARDYPRHEYLLAVDPDHLDLRLLDATDLLVVQPLSRRRIEQFLTGLEDSAGPRLYRRLQRIQLFDLASSPWLLISMLQQARQNLFPESRVDVLQRLVENALAQIDRERGVGSRAARSLYQLAWGMQIDRSSTWPVSRAFDTLAAVRGNREYDLEELYDLLVENKLLSRVGPDTTRFAYPAIQAYCTARAILGMEHLEQVLDDITASLGRLNRLRWWEGSLILLSGLTDDPNPLIESILYGASLTEGRQAFLAVRCILESGEQKGHQPVREDLVNQILDALSWRLDSDHEPRPERRTQAVQALGQLRHPSTIPDLIRVANQRLRLNWKGELDYELGNVRMAAAFALRDMMPDYGEKIQAADPPLADLLRLWTERRDRALQEQLFGGKENIQPLAAFALGDLRTQQAIESLTEGFLRPGISLYARWGVTEALLLLDPDMVLQRAILPFLDEDIAHRQRVSADTWRRRASWYTRLAYLIGQIRARHPATDAFLERCLYRFTDVSIKEMAIHALGWMYDSRYRALFEGIAIGSFEELALSKSFTSEQAISLRRSAIYALGNIGDRATVARIRANRVGWSRELERAFYHACEEIFWRLDLASNR